MPGKTFAILICLLSICCLAAKKYIPQPIVVRELSNLSVATNVGSLYLLAEDYAKYSAFDFSKANLRAVQLTLQNSSHDTYATVHQFYYADFHGIGDREYMPYPYHDALVLMDNSTAFAESVKGSVLGTLGGSAVGAALGSAIGAVTGNPVTGAATGAITGGATGGYKGYGYYKNKATIAVNNEIQSRRLPASITISPGSKITGVLFFPNDTHSIRINIEGINYDLSIDNPRENNEGRPKLKMQKRMGTSTNEDSKNVVNDYTTRVFVSKFNNQFHWSNCSKLEDSESLIGFDTPQKASEAGHLPCNYCKPF